MEIPDAAIGAAATLAGGLITGLFAVLIARHKQKVEDQRRWHEDTKGLYLDLLQWSRKAAEAVGALDELVGWQAQTGLGGRLEQELASLSSYRWPRRLFAGVRLLMEWERYDDEYEQSHALKAKELEGRWASAVEARKALEADYWANTASDVWIKLDLLSPPKTYRAARKHHGSVLTLLARFQPDKPPMTGSADDSGDYRMEWGEIADLIEGTQYIYGKTRAELLRRMRRDLKIRG